MFFWKEKPDKSEQLASTEGAPKPRDTYTKAADDFRKKIVELEAEIKDLKKQCEIKEKELDKTYNPHRQVIISYELEKLEADMLDKKHTKAEVRGLLAEVEQEKL